MTHMYGWRPDLPDHRDYLFVADPTIAVPSKVDMRSLFSPVYDQGQLGSCTANAAGGAIQFKQKQEGENDFIPSRLFVYWNTRNAEGTVSTDAGASIRDTIKTVVNYGAPPETMWPYIISKFSVRPTRKAYIAALRDKVTQYHRVPRTVSSFKACLASTTPIIVGISVYESFESISSDGVGSLPTSGEQLLGGHAILIVGYDDATQRFLFRNSWGTEWGDKGYFTLPYEYMMRKNLSADFWAITFVD